MRVIIICSCNLFILTFSFLLCHIMEQNTHNIIFMQSLCSFQYLWQNSCRSFVKKNYEYVFVTKYRCKLFINHKIQETSLCVLLNKLFNMEERLQRWTGHFREPSNLHHHWITPRITGSSLSSYLPWHDSMWQTIVCCHITQAELIVGEHWVSPPRQPEEQSRMWSNGMRKDAQRRDELCRWWWMVACCSFCGLGAQRLMMILSSNLVYEKANYLEN